MNNGGYQEGSDNAGAPWNKKDYEDMTEEELEFYGEPYTASPQPVDMSLIEVAFARIEAAGFKVLTIGRDGQCR